MESESITSVTEMKKKDKSVFTYILQYVATICSHVLYVHKYSHDHE